MAGAGSTRFFRILRLRRKIIAVPAAAHGAACGTTPAPGANNSAHVASRMNALVPIRRAIIFACVEYSERLGVLCTGRSGANRQSENRRAHSAWQTEGGL